MPNAGFLEDVVFEDPAFPSPAQASDLCEIATDASNDQQTGINSREVGESADVNDVVLESHPTSMTQLECKNDIADQVAADVGDLKVTDNIAADESAVGGEEQHTLSAEDVDAYLDKCLLQALHTTVKDKDLPMPGSTLW